MTTKTPNESIANIKNRQDAIETITSLYGTFETERGAEFLIQVLRDHSQVILDWLPDDILIELAKKHVYEEWKGYPWDRPWNGLFC